MARGKAKATKKFESKHLSRTIEARKIRKTNKDKYNRNKASNDSGKKAGARSVVQEAAREKAVGSSNVTLFDGMTMDEFLETGGQRDVLMVDADKSDEMETSHKAGLAGLKY